MNYYFCGFNRYDNTGESFRTLYVKRALFGLAIIRQRLNINKIHKNKIHTYKCMYVCMYVCMYDT